MLPLALTAALAASGLNLIDWSKATDDQRFAQLKPVMTAKEVERLKIGKEDVAQACGQARDNRGYLASAFVAYYSYKLTGRAKPVGIDFTNHGEFESPDELAKRLVQAPVSDKEWGRSDWRWDQHLPRPAQPKSKWNLVSFRADGVLYRRDKDGLYVAQSGKK